MKMHRMTAVLVVLISGFFIATTDSFAAKGGMGGGMGGGDPTPPPTGCTDVFPGFSYLQEATRKSPAEIHLGSSDGCRSERVAVVPDLRRGPTMHMTADGLAGVILWTEDPGNTEHYLVQRQDFTVAEGGLTLVGAPVTLLPRAGEGAPAEDYLYFVSTDIWGDATHDSLYLLIRRVQFFDATPSTDGEFMDELLIYNLNDMGDVREIFRTAQDAGKWNCPSDPSVLYPQFVPTCYRSGVIRFNPSGTRLYIQDNINDLQGQRWDAALRIDIDMGGGRPLTEWTFSAPELVYAGTTEFEPSGMLARPGIDSSQLPWPEYIAMRYLDRSGNQTQAVGAILDADLCAAYYDQFADGASPAAPSDLWMGCLGTTSTFVLGNLHGGGDSWQSPDTLLKSTLGKRQYDIYRHDVTDGTEQLLIENGRAADTGF